MLEIPLITLTLFISAKTISTSLENFLFCVMSLKAPLLSSPVCCDWSAGFAEFTKSHNVFFSPVHLATAATYLCKDILPISDQYRPVYEMVGVLCIVLLYIIVYYLLH
jgi:hypothetical protein